MASSSKFSRMPRSARAPVFLEMAMRAISRTAPSVTTSSTSSNPNMYRYCFSSAFFGCVSTAANCSASKCEVETISGKRPTNSGMRPYETKSTGSARPIMSSEASALRRPSASWSRSFCRSLEPKPMDDFATRDEMTCSRPSKAPPQMKRMCVVSIVRLSRSRGFFLDPSFGTEQTAPSQIFSSACCTPSPETSRVMLTFSPVLRATLSISSM
mmetsp:Transcript_16576/g.56004  ORF Transcript_16576/g.56004 Transcript_16576/m.56004 type:complete len:213 (-) Transcript_16576:795-1433(-)